MTASLLRRLVSALDPLLESRCVSCAAPIPHSMFRAPGPALCGTCSAALVRRTGGHCSRCGDLAASPHAPPSPCGDCLAGERPWDRFHFHAAYQGLARELLLRFKNGHELPLGNALGKLLAAHPDITGSYDAVIPMPLHGCRMRERGFNQALELARPLARRLGVPLAPGLLRRTAYTYPQAGLSLEARRENVRGLFVSSDAVPLRLLLVDDIATTCATLESAAAALKLAGAAIVDVVVFARTPRHVAST